MKQPHTYPPWQEQASWHEATLSLSISLSRQWSRLTRARNLAQLLAEQYASVDAALDTLCQATCPVCVDNCCRRATVWYDIRDLLVHYFILGKFPDRQISKTEAGCCSMLTESGCRLSRIERPFICTWYICPAQNELLGGKKPPGAAIQEMKTYRMEVEREFLTKAC